MDCPDQWLYEYAVIRYVPRIDREEFLNIGLIMMCKRRKWMKGEILLDESKIKNLSPAADIASLSRQASMFERKDLPFPELPIEEKYRWLTAAKSAILQTSASHPGVIIEGNEFDKSETAEYAESLLNREFDRLFSLLVK